MPHTTFRPLHPNAPTHKALRPGKMGPIVRICVWSTLVTCALSGLLDYWQTDWATSFKPLGRWPLVLHGVSGMALSICFGLLMQSHIRAAWRMKTQRLSGGSMVGLVSLLLLSGLLLYYGPEAIHDTNRAFHIATGCLFAGAILWHGLHRYPVRAHTPPRRPDGALCKASDSS